MNIRYRVTLTAEERQQLQVLLSGGQGAVLTIKRAQILLAADAQSTDDLIARTVGVGTSTVYPDQATFRRGRLGPGAARMAPPWRAAQTRRAGETAA